jgi:hypothetical protein
MTKEKRIKIGRDASSGRFVMSRSDITKLGAVEGLQQTASSRVMFTIFDRTSASPEERRREVAAKYSPKKG